jgi:hypothetical protein
LQRSDGDRNGAASASRARSVTKLAARLRQGHLGEQKTFDQLREGSDRGTPLVVFVLWEERHPDTGLAMKFAQRGGAIVVSGKVNELRGVRRAGSRQQPCQRRERFGKTFGRKRISPRRVGRRWRGAAASSAGPRDAARRSGTVPRRRRRRRRASVRREGPCRRVRRSPDTRRAECAPLLLRMALSQDEGPEQKD